MLVGLRAQWRSCAPYRQSIRGVKNLTGVEFINWVLPKEGDKLNVFKAVLRETTGQKAAQELRKEDLVPICIINRGESCRKKTRSLQIDAAISRKDVLNVYKTGRLQNQVFEIQVEGRAERVKAVVSNYYRENVRFQPLALTFTTFHPDKRYKIKVPSTFSGMQDSIALKKGAELQKVEDWIPMYWKGGEQIPHMISIDLLHARPPIMWHMDNVPLPDGLSYQHPRHRYVLASLKGSRKYTSAEDEEADADAAASGTAGKKIIHHCLGIWRGCGMQAWVSFTWLSFVQLFWFARCDGLPIILG